MSFCQACGDQKRGNTCHSCSSNKHVHGSSHPYTGYSGAYNQQHTLPQQSQNITVHQLLHPNACGEKPINCLDGYSTTNGGGRPILSGIFDARDSRGGAVPFAKVTVTFSGTSNFAAIFSDSNLTKSLPNPATTDIYGRMPLYYAGGPIDILVEKTDAQGNSCGVVEKIFNEGGYVDSDFELSKDEVKECIDIQSPLFRLYDKDNCQLPVGMISPEFALQWANFKAGLPVGKYSEVKKFFQCLGTDFECGITVIGDTNGSRYRYDCENCTETCPPDPETVQFQDDGTSECWTDINRADVVEILSPITVACSIVDDDEALEKLEDALNITQWTNIQVFNADGTWTVPDGVEFVDVTVIGGGGGGEASHGNDNGGAGGGGGGGGKSEGVYAVTSGDSIPVMIGAGGSGRVTQGPQGNTGTTNRVPGRGGTSSFGSLASATGGYGGSAYQGGEGGQGVGGDINSSIGSGHNRSIRYTNGNPGSIGAWFTGGNGAGGSAEAPVTNTINVDGQNASLPGHGGSGANTGSSNSGGDGFRGTVVVRW